MSTPRRRAVLVALGLASAFSMPAGSGARVETAEPIVFGAASADGRATGTTAVTYTFRSWCEPDERANSLVVDSGEQPRFVLGRVIQLVCRSRDKE